MMQIANDANIMLYGIYRPRVLLSIPKCLVRFFTNCFFLLSLALKCPMPGFR